MDLRKLKTLIDLVSESNVSELEITEAEGKVRIVKGGGAVVQQVAAPVLAPVAVPVPAVAAPVAPAAAAVAGAPAQSSRNAGSSVRPGGTAGDCEQQQQQ